MLMPTMYFEQKRFRAAKSRKCPSHLFDDGNREGTFCVETHGPVAFLQRLAFFERGYLKLKSGVSSMQRSRLHLGSVYDPGVGMSDTPICVVPLVVPNNNKRKFNITGIVGPLYYRTGAAVSSLTKGATRKH